MTSVRKSERILTDIGLQNIEMTSKWSSRWFKNGANGQSIYNFLYYWSFV